MSENSQPLSQTEFRYIFSKVPRLTVEIVARNGEGAVLLTKRSIEPCKGKWHLPGGTVRFGEPLEAAVKRIALTEIGIEPTQLTNIGYIEYPSHYLNNLDSPVGIVFEVVKFNKQPRPKVGASATGWFLKLPDETHADLDQFLIKNRLITA